MKHWLGSISFGIWICVTPVLAGDCLPYGGAKPLTLKGNLTSHQGLRTWWGVKLDQAICTVKHPTDPYGVAYSDVKETHLIFLNPENSAKYERLLNHRVAVSGKLMGRTTAYHQTSVLIIVDEIASLDGAQIQTPQAVKRALPSLRDLESYFASVSVLPRPASRVVKQAWDTDQGAFFADSDRYVEHMFNGPMDVMWVKCREGYRVESSESSSNSSLFQMDTRRVAVGTAITDRPPHRSVRAELPHTAPA